MCIKNILDRTFDIIEPKCLIKNNFIKKTTIMQYMYNDMYYTWHLQ